MIEIAFVSGKGGTGKTLVTHFVAKKLASWGLNVIAVDADAEAPNLHIALGVERWSQIRAIEGGLVASIDLSKCVGCGSCFRVCTFGAVVKLDSGYAVDELVCEGCRACSFVCPVNAISFRERVLGYIKVAELGPNLVVVSSEIECGRPNSGRVVTEARQFARSVCRSGHCVILIDSAAGIGCPVISSIAGCTLAIGVAEPTPTSLSDLKRVYTVAKHFAAPMKIVINKSGLSDTWERKICEFAESEGLEILARIPFDPCIPRALSTGLPVEEACRGRPVLDALEMLAERIREIVMEKLSRSGSGAQRRGSS